MKRNSSGWRGWSERDGSWTAAWRTCCSESKPSSSRIGRSLARRPQSNLESTADSLRVPAQCCDRRRVALAPAAGLQASHGGRLGAHPRCDFRLGQASALSRPQEFVQEGEFLSLGVILFLDSRLIEHLPDHLLMRQHPPVPPSSCRGRSSALWSAFSLTSSRKRGPDAERLRLELSQSLKLVTSQDVFPSLGDDRELPKRATEGLTRCGPEAGIRKFALRCSPAAEPAAGR